MARTSYIVGFFCWLLVSLVSANAAGPVKLTSIELAQIEKAQFESCQKLSAHLPSKEKCSGVAAQSAATARSRSSKDKELVLAKVGTVRPLAPVAFVPEVAPLPDLQHAKRRRAHFWQVYASAMRLRN